MVARHGRRMKLVSPPGGYLVDVLTVLYVFVFPFLYTCARLIYLVMHCHYCIHQASGATERLFQCAP